MLTEFENIKQWIAEHQLLIEPYYAHDESHPTGKINQTFRNIIIAIKAGDKKAISLAIMLFQDDPKMPFGKSIKCTLARALNRHKAHLRPNQIQIIVGLINKLRVLRYPPTELKYLERLVKHLNLLDD